METRRRISDAKIEEKDGARRTSLTSGESADEAAADPAADPDAGARSSRAQSEQDRSRAESGQERKLKVRQTHGSSCD